MEKTMENFWPEIAAADARWLDRHVFVTAPMSLIYGMSLTALVPFCELGFSVWRFGLDAWHNDIRGCAVCWQSFRPTREAPLLLTEMPEPSQGEAP